MQASGFGGDLLRRRDKLCTNLDCLILFIQHVLFGEVILSRLDQKRVAAVADIVART
nr:MAG: hypothetical protein [Bacteriophage sp.]